MNYDDYMGEVNENEISDGNMKIDELSLGKKQMPVKLHIKKQEVKKTFNKRNLLQN